MIWTCWEDFQPTVDMAAILAPLPSADFTTPNLVKQFSRYLGRPIVLVQMSLMAKRYWGAWVNSPICEFVVYERNTARFHQHHIVLHESSHVMLGHPTATISEQAAMRFLCRLPEDCGPRDLALISPLEQVLEQALQRGSDQPASCDDEADALATLLQNEIIQRAGLAALTDAAIESSWAEVAQGLWNLTNP